MPNPNLQSDRAHGAPSFAGLDQLQERHNILWFSSHALSTLVHTIAVAWVVQTGIVTAVYLQRYGAGYQFGTAVLLASPLFELADRNMVRGRQQNIPLSALVPQQQLYAPDLRRLGLLNPATHSGQPGPLDASQQPADSIDPSPSILSIPFSGGGGALPSGTAASRPTAQPLTPFDMVPPSNSRAAKPGDRQLQRIVLGDASSAGGGAREGLRLPPSPARVSSSLELTVESELAPAMEEYLRILLGRYRRACLDVLTDKRDFGPPGQLTLALVIDRAGRISRSSTLASSGNSEFDRLALSAVALTPSFHPLPPNLFESHVVATLRVRYWAR